jgi:hypothetical protein
MFDFDRLLRIEAALGVELELVEIRGRMYAIASSGEGPASARARRASSNSFVPFRSALLPLRAPEE